VRGYGNDICNKGDKDILLNIVVLGEKRVGEEEQENILDGSKTLNQIKIASSSFRPVCPGPSRNGTV
jgi:hypothetical protein